MCNLSEMIEERGIEKGIEKMVMNALRKCSPEQVSEMLDVPIDQVKEIEKEMLVHLPVEKRWLYAVSFF